MEELRINSAKLTIQLIQMVGPAKFEQAISSAFRLNRGQRLLLLSEEGQRYATRDSISCPNIGKEEVEALLQGGTVNPLEGLGVPMCLEGGVGVPFEYEGTRYALYVLPNPSSPNKRVDKTDIRNLITVILISSLIVALAVIYLVRPLRRITEATKRIAARRFQG